MGPNGVGQDDPDQDPDRPREARLGRGQARPQGPGRLPRPGARSRSPPETTVVRAVWPEDDPDWVEGDVRDLLARFGLTGEIVFQTVGQLSGGEKAKAALARLCATGANLLVMDEPTNHLDIWSCEALERSIREFEGTVLVVSHDRYFLNQVADRLIVVADGRARVIEGDYETYQHLAQQRSRSAPSKAAAASRAAAATAPTPVVRRQVREAQAKVPLPQGGRHRARDRRARRPRSPSSKTCSASPPPGATRSRPSAPRIATTMLKETLATLYEHWEDAVDSNS